MTEPLTLAHFAGTEGAAYTLEAGGTQLEMVLESAEPLPPSPRPGGSFRLQFRGPLEPLLPEAIYPFEHGGDRFEIFVVPVAQDARGTEYEAIFF